jgi:hypothetical protein
MNGTIFNGQQNTPQHNAFYPYGYTAAMAPIMRPDPASYMMPQTAQPAFIKGRPVSSLEEARVAQVDLDGSVFIFPDFGNKKIYTKRINADGTASLNTYSLDILQEEEEPQYVTKNEFLELRTTLDEIIGKLKVSAGAVPPSTPTSTQTQPKITF